MAKKKVQLLLKEMLPDKSEYKALGWILGSANELTIPPVFVEFELDPSMVVYQDVDAVVITPDGLGEIGRILLERSKEIEAGYDKWLSNFRLKNKEK